MSVDLHPDNAIRVLSVCSGIEGLGLGVKRAVPSARIVCYVEREGFACEVLASRIEDGLLDPAPCFTDLRALDGRRFRGAVDMVLGGPPCQPVSCAGKRKGAEDARWLWPDFLRVAVESEAPLVFFENVAGLLSHNQGRTFRGMCADLGRVGYRVEAPSGVPVFGLFSAEEVGAPHRRQRVFLLAYAERLLDERRRGHGLVFAPPPERAGDQRERGGDPADDRVEALADAESQRPGEAGRLRSVGSKDGSRRSVEALADDDDDGREGERRIGILDRLRQALRHDAHGSCGEAVVHAEGLSEREPHVGVEQGHLATDARGSGSRSTPRPARWPPLPDDRDAWRAVLAVRPDLEPALPSTRTEPKVCRMAHGAPRLLDGDPMRDRIDRLRALGNAVNPDTAEKATRELFGRLLRDI